MYVHATLLFFSLRYAWPNTLPFADCTEASCTGHKL